MAEESKMYTAFATPSGLYQFTRKPFGLVNSESKLNGMIRKLLKGTVNIDAHVDDVLQHNRVGTTYGCVTCFSVFARPSVLLGSQTYRSGDMSSEPGNYKWNRIKWKGFETQNDKRRKSDNFLVSQGSIGSSYQTSRALQSHSRI